MKAAFLQINSFTYIGSIGAEHFYGQLIFKDPNEKYGTKRIEIKQPMSTKMALYSNKKDESRGLSMYKPGELTDRFNSVKELIDFNIKLFNREYQDTPLIMGDHCVMSAQPFIYWPKSIDKIVKKCNKLALEWEKINGYDGDVRRAEEIDKEWFNLAKRLL